MEHEKNWVYQPKKITVTRGIGYGLTDLMGGGWNRKKEPSPQML